MKYLAKSGLLVLCICVAYALFAFFDTPEINAEKQTITTVPNSSQSSTEIKIETDKLTGLPVLVYFSNSILYTNDISKAQSEKLFQHFRETSFFTSASENKVMIGKEPNNYVLFYQHNPQEFIPYLQLHAFAVSIAANVFNHQPLVVKLIDEEKEVVRIVTAL